MMMPAVWNPMGDWMSKLADDAIGKLAKAIMEGMSQMVTTLATFWVDTPTVNLTSGEGGPSPVVAAINNELLSWTLAVAVLAVILGGIRMIWEQRGAPLKDVLRSLITLTLVSGLGLSVISILVIAADAFSVGIIDRATDGKGFAEALSVLTMTGNKDIAVFVLIILGLIGLIASLVQIVLMIVRSGMLVILAGILPTTAAFTNTEMGKQWFQKAVGWTIAFILYKPAAAIVYAVAFRLMDVENSGGGLVGSISGFTLMVVALFALPALMRFVTPMVGAVASGSGSGAGAAAAMGAVATGAVSMGRMGNGKGAAAPTPAGGKSGQASQAQGNNGAQGARTNGATPSPGTNGSGTAGGRGSTGAAGTAGAAGSTGAASAAGTAGSTGAAGAAGTAGAASAAGPVGVVAGAAVQVASRTAQAINDSAQNSTGEGPSGSNQ